ncbi:MAG: hypothetical protein AB9846_11830 [Tenuifilaceae bacterium]
MRIKILSILIFFSVSVFSQESEIDSKITHSSTLSKGTIVIGDQVQYNISVIIPNNYKVTFPSYSDSLMKGVELVRSPLLEEVKRKDDKKEFVMKMIITSFDSGSYELPSAAIAVSDESKTDTIKTNPLWLTVNTIPRDTTLKDIYDIKAPIKEPLTFAEVAPWAFGGILLAAIIFLLVIYIRRRKQNKPFSFIQKPIDPPHVIALRELEKIRHEKLWVTENHKQYYTRLIDVIRVYIEGRYGIMAMEQTTDEILDELKLVGFNDKELFISLDETLSLADLVKFAKYTPVISDNEQSLKFAFNFVEKTKQEVEIVSKIVQEEELAKPLEELTEINQEQAKNTVS